MNYISFIFDSVTNSMGSEKSIAYGQAALITAVGVAVFTFLGQKVKQHCERRQTAFQRMQQQLKPDLSSIGDVQNRSFSQLPILLQNADTALSILKNNPDAYLDLPLVIKKNPRVAKAFLLKKPSQFLEIPDSLRKQEWFVRMAMGQSMEVWSYIDKKSQNCPEVKRFVANHEDVKRIISRLAENIESYTEWDPNLYKNRLLIDLVLEKFPALKETQAFMERAIEANPSLGTEPFWIEMAKNRPLLFQQRFSTKDEIEAFFRSAPEFSENEELMGAFIRADIRFASYLHTTLKQQLLSREVMGTSFFKKLLREKGIGPEEIERQKKWAIEIQLEIKPLLKNDKNFMLDAIRCDPCFFRMVDPELFEDLQFLMTILRIPRFFLSEGRFFLDHAADKFFQLLGNAKKLPDGMPEEIIRNRPFILKAIEKGCFVLQDYGRIWGGDKEIVRQAVLMHPEEFRYAAFALRLDENFILTLWEESFEAGSVAERHTNVFIQRKLRRHFKFDPQDLKEKWLKIIDYYGLKMRTFQNFPEVSHKGSRGVDVGGLTRDFIGRILEQVFNEHTNPLQAAFEDGKALPLISKGDDFAKTIQFYRTLGALFARAEASPEFVLGNYFDPLLFKMIRSLTKEEVKDLNPRLLFDDKLDLELSDRVSSQTYRKLNEIYQGQRPFLHIEAFRQQWEQDVVSPAVFAALVIARSIYETQEWEDIKGKPNLVEGRPVQVDLWERMKKDSPENFQRAVEGAFSKEDLLREDRILVSGFDHLHDRPQQVLKAKNLFKKWINESSPQKVQGFLFALSGSKTLSPNRSIVLGLHGDSTRFPVFHTCNYTVDLYLDVNKNVDEQYPEFERKLNSAVEEVARGNNRFDYV